MHDFLSAHTAYELIPESGKVVVLDVELPVRQAFHALHEQSIASAPLWDPRYVGPCYNCCVAAGAMLLLKPVQPGRLSAQPGCVTAHAVQHGCAALTCVHVARIVLMCCNAFVLMCCSVSTPMQQHGAGGGHDQRLGLYPRAAQAPQRQLGGQPHERT